ncbi:hypothetical protein [Pontibacter burrus]|uniref:Uncharacterized protein n=1 Tax=Pontibacter burrus TaxID=2704466 RepID=A0A6B3LRS0_9BACT|nr:hypothetical protein [Pontibacter burrus]NEM96170.1 hypothetical protein [Pontibacter burrus]
MKAKAISTKSLKVGDMVQGAQGLVEVSEILDETRIRIKGNSSSFIYGICFLPIKQQ